MMLGVQGMAKANELSMDSRHDKDNMIPAVSKNDKGNKTPAGSRHNKDNLTSVGSSQVKSIHRWIDSEWLSPTIIRLQVLR